MDMKINNLCRLCARNDEFSKDILEESNKNVHKMIKDLVQIIVNENESLPTKICVECESKLISFQQFINECHQVQDTLRNFAVKDLGSYEVKIELQQCTTEIEDGSALKCEVKDEVLGEDLARVLRNDGTLEISMYEEDIDNKDCANDSDSDFDCLDNMTIASLTQIETKTISSKQIKRRIERKAAEDLMKEILKTPKFKVKDIVKFECVLCEETSKNWSNLRVHYLHAHNSEPLALCLCGYEIKSKSILYKHVSDHRLEAKKLHKSNSNDDEDDKNESHGNLNVKDFVKFICYECNVEYKSWYSLRAHSEQQHNATPAVTCSCGVTLKSKSVMYKHVQDHKAPNVLACDKCPRITKSLAALNKHKMRHIPKSERRYNCESCTKVFQTRDALKSHERSHLPIEDRKIYRCEICNVKFTTPSAAAAHKRVVHDKIKGYVCDLCGYACGTGGELRQHRAIHSDDRNFVCRKCSKPFKTYSNLKTHMDTHEDTSYECYICRRVLNSRRTLRKHLLVHEDKCRHVCSYCNKAFKRRQTLKVHMYTHTGDKPLTCKWCDERFSYASTLRSHRLRCHPDKMAPPPAALAHYHYDEQHNYIKNDVVAVSVPVAKNEVEAM